MQTERVTFLTTPDHKAALDTFAANSGMSVGRLVREATSQYFADTAGDRSNTVVVEAAFDELERSLPEWQAKLTSIEQAIDNARQAIRSSIVAADAMK